LFLKTTAAVVYCLELAHIIVLSNMFYIKSIKQYGNSNILLTQDPIRVSLPVAGFLGAAANFLMQVSFTNRVRMCYKTPHIAIICWVLASVRFMGFIVAIVLAIRLGPSFHLFQTKWAWILIALWVDNVIVDTIIAASLCYFLAKGRQRSRSRHTIQLINRIIAMTIPTGLVTSVTDMAIVVCFLSSNNPFIWVTIQICEPNIFGNSFFASLNSRSALRNMGPGHISNLILTKTNIAHAIEIETSQVVDVLSDADGYSAHESGMKSKPFLQAE